VHFAYSHLAFSVNYFVSEDEMTVDDPNATLKMYEDKKSVTGNAVKVKEWLLSQRYILFITFERIANGNSKIATFLLGLRQVGII
jgi:hypothetical protein